MSQSTRSPGPLRLVASASLFIGLAACTRTSSDRSDGADTVSGARASSLQQATAPLAVLLDSIRRLSGDFHLVGGGSRWDFSGDQSVFAQFPSHGDSAVVALVDCLGDTSRVVASTRGEPVTVGFMCFTALQRVASYEWGQEDEVGGIWPGIIEPRATPDQLRQAQRAWQEVIDRKAYRLE